MTEMPIVFFLMAFGLAAAAQNKPDFSGIWVRDREHSGPERVSWASTRPTRFEITQEPETISIDTGDGSLFGLHAALAQEPLVWPLDGTSKTFIDHSLGDLPNFTRKIRTEGKWDGLKLITLTTHLSEADGKETGGITRVLAFELREDRRAMTVERTGYRKDARVRSAHSAPWPYGRRPCIRQGQSNVCQVHEIATRPGRSFENRRRSWGRCICILHPRRDNSQQISLIAEAPNSKSYGQNTHAARE